MGMLSAGSGKLWDMELHCSGFLLGWKAKEK